MAFLGTRCLVRLHNMLAEVDGELPWFFKALSNIGKFYGLDALILLLFVLGILALVLIPDRLRANLYAALIAVLMVAFGGIFYLCGTMPLMRVIENLGQ